MAPKPPVFAVDDTEYTDEWQKEVYEAAKHIMDENRLSSVYDIGCGSGYKLLKFMGNFDTTGIDLPETISVVRKRYPDRKWIDTPFDQAALTKADLVICADVIEHVSDPDALMRFIVRRAAKWIVMSTPDRDLVYPYKWVNKHYYGPPGNPAHVREWTMREFHSYVQKFVKIDRHEITNLGQGTQMVVARVTQ